MNMSLAPPTGTLLTVIRPRQGPVASLRSGTAWGQEQPRRQQQTLPSRQTSSRRSGWGIRARARARAEAKAGGAAGDRSRPWTSWAAVPASSSRTSSSISSSSRPWSSKLPSSWEEVSPVKVAVWVSAAMAGAALLQLLGRAVLFNPAVWMYATWWLVVWPLPAAVALGAACLLIGVRQVKGKAREWEQVVALCGGLLWLVLVPLASVHGYVDGWPLLLWALYVAFFFINAVLRLRLYGQLSPQAATEESQEKDLKWSRAPAPSLAAKLAFVGSVAAGHWLAAFEAQPLLLSWDFGWTSKLAASLLLLAFVLHWNGTWFLGKYSNRLIRPRAVVMFGPYRFVRHPIYGSYMLLFAGYCVALRAYWSLLLLTLACWLYYEQRIKLEEEQLVDAFGNLYTNYRGRVRKKYLPFLL